MEARGRIFDEFGLGFWSTRKRYLLTGRQGWGGDAEISLGVEVEKKSEFFDSS